MSADENTISGGIYLALPFISTAHFRAVQTVSEKEEKIMSGTSDKAKGTLDKAAGKVKENVGKLTGDKKTENKGKGQQVKGSAEKIKGEVKDAFNS